MIAGDPLGNEIFLDHFHEIGALDVLRCRPCGQSFRVKVGLTAKLIDTLGHRSRMRLLFLRVLVEFLLHSFACDSGGANRVHRISQHAYNLRREYALQDLDGLFYIALIGRSHSASVDAGPRLLP